MACHGADNGPRSPGLDLLASTSWQLHIYNDTASHLGAYQADLLLVAYI